MTTYSNMDVLMAKLTEQSCSEMIKGIRANRHKETRYISSCIQLIKKQLTSNNVALKSIGVSKLIYLNIIGYDVSWATFHIIELMSSLKIDDKRIAFLAASLIFKESDDLIIMATNLLRKSITSPNYFESFMAISCLGDIMNDSLAVDLFEDVIRFMMTVKPPLKKRCIILLQNIFSKSSESLKTSFIRLKECLEDSNNGEGVRMITAKVFSYLIHHNPKNFLPMAPLFYQIHTKSSSPYLSVITTSILNELAQIEPRLAKKIGDNFLSTLDNSNSPALVFESLNGLSQCLLDDDRVVKIVITKLKIYLESTDENLKFLALTILGKIVKKKHNIVAYLKDPIFNCFENKDEFIKIKVLSLINAMVNQATLQSLCQNILKLISHATSITFVEVCINKIIELCSFNNYQDLNDFEWYLTILLEMTVYVERYALLNVGKTVSVQIMDVVQRVKAVRSSALKKMVSLFVSIKKQNLLVRFHAICDILLVCGWCIGEYFDFANEEFLNMMNISNTAEFNSLISIIINSLLDVWVLGANFVVQSVFIHASVKLVCRYYYFLHKDKIDGFNNTDCTLLKITLERLNIFGNVYDAEVNERVFVYQRMLFEMVESFNKDVNCLEEIQLLFQQELPPIPLDAQSKVPLPSNLNLNEPINPLFNSHFFKSTSKNNTDSTLPDDPLKDNDNEDWESIVGPNVLTSKLSSSSKAKQKKPTASTNQPPSKTNNLKINNKQTKPNPINPTNSTKNSTKQPTNVQPINTKPNMDKNAAILYHRNDKEVLFDSITKSNQAILTQTTHSNAKTIKYVVEPLEDVHFKSNNDHSTPKQQQQQQQPKQQQPKNAHLLSDFDVSDILKVHSSNNNQTTSKKTPSSNKSTNDSSSKNKTKLISNDSSNNHQQDKQVNKPMEEKDYKLLIECPNDNLPLDIVYRLKNLQTTPTLVIKLTNQSDLLLINQCIVLMSDQSIISIQDPNSSHFNKLINPNTSSFLQIPFILNPNQTKHDCLLLEGSLDISYTTKVVETTNTSLEQHSLSLNFKCQLNVLELVYPFKLTINELADLLMDGTMNNVQQAKTLFKSTNFNNQSTFIEEYLKKNHFYGVEKSANKFSAVAKYHLHNNILCLLVKIDQANHEIYLILKSNCDNSLLLKLCDEMMNNLKSSII